MTILIRNTLVLMTCALASGCVAPQKVKQAQQDAAIYKAQQSERDSNERCSQTAIPGSMEHLECRMVLSHGGDSAGK